MHCPACGNRKFQSVKLESGLAVERCSACEGVWLELETYRDWRRKTPEIVEDVSVAELAEDSDTARFCPLTGRLMARVKVTNESPFRIDFSPAAQAVWLDKGEWEGLHALGLHRQLDAIVSERWQRELQSAALRERLEQAQRKRFGDAYDELLKIREWLRSQPNTAEMVAFLGARAD